MNRKVMSDANGAALYSGLYHDAVALAPSYLRLDLEVAEQTIKRVAALMQKRKQTGPIAVQSPLIGPLPVADRSAGEKP